MRTSQEQYQAVSSITFKIKPREYSVAPDVARCFEAARMHQAHHARVHGFLVGVSVLVHAHRDAVVDFARHSYL